MKQPKRDRLRDNAIVLEIGERFYCGVNKNKQIMTAWSLAGAKLFCSWNMKEINAVEQLLKKRGKSSKRIIVSLDYKNKPKLLCINCTKYHCDSLDMDCLYTELRRREKKEA